MSELCEGDQVIAFTPNSYVVRGVVYTEQEQMLEEYGEEDAIEVLSSDGHVYLCLASTARHQSKADRPLGGLARDYYLDR
jgi:hypothetical protein